jgi:hypothetical protein
MVYFKEKANKNSRQKIDDDREVKRDKGIGSEERCYTIL